MDAQETVTIHGDTWKWSDIREEVEWCRTRTWERKHWVAHPRQSATDGISPHDHCRICWWTLADSSDPAVSIGYHAGRDIWLCTECYDKFIAVATRNANKNATHEPLPRSRLRPECQVV